MFCHHVPGSCLARKATLEVRGFTKKHCLVHLLSCGITFRLSSGFDKGSTCSHFSWHEQETRCCLESTLGNLNSQYDCGLTTALSHFAQGFLSTTSDLADGMVPQKVTRGGQRGYEYYTYCRSHMFMAPLSFNESTGAREKCQFGPSSQSARGDIASFKLH